MKTLSRSLPEALNRCLDEGTPQLAISAMSVARIQATVRTSESRVETLIGQAASDPALAASLLREANGTLYVGLQPLFSLDEAVQRIGQERAVDLLTAVLRDGLLQSADPLLRSTLEGTWRHSLAVACAARLIAEERGRPELAGECYLLGLLSDLGAIFLIGALANGLGGAIQPDELTATAKRDILVQLQEEYGSRLMEAWSFPAVTLRVLGGRGLSPDERERTLVVRTARQLVSMAGLHPIGRPPDPRNEDVLWELAEILGLEDVELAALQVRTEDLLVWLDGAAVAAS